MKPNFKRAFIRLIVKGYGVALLLCLVAASCGIALLVAPLFSGYIYHESHFVGGLVALIVPALIIIAASIPTKKDKII